ncbi:MAG: gluconate 2-dehydrogenase subunit 3 family protein [Gemmatimonadaceae bacterium]|jgi:hypothetical protein|nr:gluconate 2-dehydrogenase subunit 3 family protein [Gemmatimonadaceae bacterium]
MSDALDPTRRTLLKAGAAAAALAALPACTIEDRRPVTDDARPADFDRTVLDAAAELILPGDLDLVQRRAATDAFVRWVEGYMPVAEEMHGYGYPDIRYLPPDPAPAWRAQLDGLDLLAQRRHGARFATLERSRRAELIDELLRPLATDRLPPPLAAPHVLLALLSHWAAQPDAWDLAFEVRVARNTCRALDDAVRPPRPLAPQSLG